MLNSSSFSCAQYGHKTVDLNRKLLRVNFIDNYIEHVTTSQSE